VPVIEQGEEVNDAMGLTKHGRGEVLPEPEETVKTAAKDWSEEDEADLDEENKA